jgi:hypothetical protein
MSIVPSTSTMFAWRTTECGGAAHERAAQRVDGQVDDELAPHRA